MDINPTPERRHREQQPPPTVLVVDDSAAIRMILSRTLRANGLRVVEAANGQEALTYCALEHPDLMLLDVDMPIMGGLEVLRRMAANDDADAVPVLMLTAQTAGHDAAHAIELGAQDYLRKPCDPDELLARVRRALSLKAKSDALHRRADELGEISSTDELTGLGNRRHLVQEVSALIEAWGGSARIGVLMVDIDHFKAVNDTEGHLAGDEVLSQLAARLRATVANRAIAVRWGGEEFVLLVTRRIAVDPVALAEAVRLAVCEAPFVVGDEKMLNITVSIGVAEGTADSLSAAIQAADEALYRAKSSGRNRVVAAS